LTKNDFDDVASSYSQQYFDPQASALITPKTRFSKKAQHDSSKFYPEFKEMKKSKKTV
jgi:hypothetical protein